MKLVKKLTSRSSNPAKRWDEAIRIPEIAVKLDVYSFKIPQNLEKNHNFFFKTSPDRHYNVPQYMLCNNNDL